MTLDKIPLAGVIGSPIAHSRSPQLQMHWLKTMGLPGYYIPMDVMTKDLEEVIRTLPKQGFVGVNVTIPHKEKVLDIADLVTDRATMIGAANTLIFRKDGKIHADNTDGYGFFENLRANAPQWNPKEAPAAVLGAGGASRAVVASLLDSGVPQVFLANRTRIRAEKLADDLGHRVKVVDWVHAPNMLDEVNLLVNTTSLGMIGKAEMRVPLDGLRPGMIVNDLVYTPLKTKLLEESESAGCTAIDGLGMLLYQAVPGFERWFGQRPTVDSAARAAALR